MAAGPGMPTTGASSSHQQQLHPPSTAASAVASPSTSAAVEPLKMASVRRKDGTTLPTSAAASTTTPGLNLNIPLKLPRGESTRATDRTDALWAEMQATLEEVELSAGGGTRVFGPDHDRKLGELRLAQIALAQAWARSEADDAIETVGGNAKGPATGGTTDGAVTDATGKTDAGAAAAAGGATTGTDGGAAKSSGTGSGRPGSSGMGGTGLGGHETDVDILLARKRREANDRYFQRVNQGVLDVVAKLEEVAIAMRAVEQESKDFVWGDGDNESAPESAKS